MKAITVRSGRRSYRCRPRFGSFLLLAVIVFAGWLDVESAHAIGGNNFDLRCYDWRAGAEFSNVVEVSEGDSFVINVWWMGHSFGKTYYAEWDTKTTADDDAISGTDYEPRDRNLQSRSSTSNMNHTFHTHEDELYEGTETYRAGYLKAWGG